MNQKMEKVFDRSTFAKYSRAMGLGVLLIGIILIAYPKIGAAQETKEIKIGVIDAFSGFLAKTCGWNKKAYQMAEDDINRAGGIDIAGGAKIKLIFGDNEGKPQVGMAIAEKLINEGVVALVGCYQSDVSYATTQVAEKYKVPQIIPIAVADEITERGFKYTFRQNIKASWLGRDTMEFLEYVGKKTGLKPKTAVILGNDTSYPQSVAKAHRKYAEQTGLVKIVGEFSYPMRTSDLSTEITKIRFLKPDVLLTTAYLPDGILVVRTMAELGMTVMGHNLIGGATEIEFATTLHDLTEGVMSCGGGWNPDIKVPGAKELGDRFKKRYGRNMANITGMCYATIFTLKQALEMAGSADREKLRKALTEIHIPLGQGILPHGIRFGPDGQNIEAKNLMFQWRKGKLLTVWPPIVASSEPVWPMPTWKR